MRKALFVRAFLFGIPFGLRRGLLRMLRDEVRSDDVVAGISQVGIDCLCGVVGEGLYIDEVDLVVASCSDVDGGVVGTDGGSDR